VILQVAGDGGATEAAPDDEDVAASQDGQCRSSGTYGPGVAGRAPRKAVIWSTVGWSTAADRPTVSPTAGPSPAQIAHAANVPPHRLGQTASMAETDNR